ncbi:MAG: hypothetical protein ACR2Q3_07395 [Woeseiaceae bacterium]
MKDYRVLHSIFAMAVLLQPFASQAATDKDAVQACAKALADTIELSQGAPLSVRIDEESSDSTQKLKHRNVYHLNAVAPGSTDIVARADCFVNRKAQVTSLVTLPLRESSEIYRGRI